VFSYELLAEFVQSKVRSPTLNTGRHTNETHGSHIHTAEVKQLSTKLNIVVAFLEKYKFIDGRGFNKGRSHIEIILLLQRKQIGSHKIRYKADALWESVHHIDCTCITQKQNKEGTGRLIKKS
jgi:hypothetical protein